MARKAGQGKEEEESRARQQEGRRQSGREKTPDRHEDKIIQRPKNHSVSFSAEEKLHCSDFLSLWQENPGTARPIVAKHQISSRCKIWLSKSPVVEYGSHSNARNRNAFDAFLAMEMERKNIIVTRPIPAQ
ncbi:hypothetical protein STEG23_002837 [Scotinomys teguina]